ncbi:hypothetical protein WQ54_12625 [Bacillus sp. SA1-12]|uniref:FxLYD domain-containing protein n=1 Tax=Bacillus sp. SA1-12 TaxID=1455638 RepID=UPI000626D127|nr:FxLYD domain-containing protein [Bacillus sp. SA1-12]KKI91815.1 hypothetical protein WQ54_12625 [Bacillus sp. SA1-12]
METEIKETKKPPKKIIIITSISALLIAGIFIFYYFRVNEEEFKEFVTTLQEDEELSKYFSEYLYVEDDYTEPTNYEEYKLMPYILSAYTTDEFNNLTKEEKQGITLKLVDAIDYQGWIKCGNNNKICDIQSVMVHSKNENDKSELFSYDFNTSKFQYGEYNGEDLKFEEINIDLTESTSTDTDDTPSLEVVEHKGTIDGDFIYVTGAIKNNSETAYSFVEVKSTYFDENGNILDTETSFVNSSDVILPNERKGFEIMTQMIGQKYPKYKVEVVNYKPEY